MTLKRTLRPGPITVHRVMGGIAGYLLIGYTWTFAYQLLVQQLPGAIHFSAGVPDTLSRQPNHLIYFSFITLATVGYGDAYPVHPAVRSLAVAEALVGQLYIAILIASLVGMALQAKSAKRTRRIQKGLSYTGCKGQLEIAHSTIDHQFAAHCECGLVGSKEDDGLRDFSCVSEAPRGNLAENGVSHCLEFSLGQPELAVEGRRDRTGTDGIHPDSTTRQFAREGLGQRQERGL